MKLNECIREFRRFRNMSQAELAEKISKSKSVISHWESGENSPDPDSCEKLCKVLKVTPNQLFGWEDNPDYLVHVKRMQEYQADINALEAQIFELRRKIEEIEILKYQEQNPFVDDD